MINCLSNSIHRNTNLYPRRLGVLALGLLFFSFFSLPLYADDFAQDTSEIIEDTSEILDFSVNTGDIEDGTIVAADLNTALINSVVLVNGSNAMTGNLDMGNNDIVNADQIGIGVATVDASADLEINGQIKINGGTPGAGQVLTSDANGLATWETPSGGGSAGGADSQIQFNNAGVFAGDVEFFWDDTTNRLGIGLGETPATRIQIVGDAMADGYDDSWVGVTGDPGWDGISILEDNSTIVMLSDDDFGWGSKVDFVQMDDDNAPGSHFENQWTIVRKTNGDGSPPSTPPGSVADGTFRIMYGTDADFRNNTTMLMIDDNGSIGIGVAENSVPDPAARLEVVGQIKITGGSPAAGEVLTSDANGLATWEDNSPKFAQFFNDVAQNINTGGAGTFSALQWTSPGSSFNNAIFTVNGGDNTRLDVAETGVYRVRYNVNYDADGSRKNIRCRVEVNGTPLTQGGESYTYTRNGSNDNGTNVAEVIVNMNAGTNFFRVQCARAGDAGTANTINAQTWTIIEKMSN